MRIYERFGGISLLAGFGCYFLAFGLIVFAPAILTNAGEQTVVDVITGETVRVADYTPEEAAGREVYINQVCWHCHSQFIRPVNEENLRWGPVSQPGESVIDTPHLYGTRRIGPDLAREGGRRIDDWHIAHFMDPRYTVEASVMPEYPWFFRDHANAGEIDDWIKKLDSDGDGVVSRKWDNQQHWPEWPKNDQGGDITPMDSPLIDNEGTVHPNPKQEQDTAWIKEKYVDVFVGDPKGDGVLTNYDSRARPTKDLTNLILYLQRLGTAVGKWREWPQMDTPTRSWAPGMRGVEVNLGKFDTVDDDGNPVEQDWIASVPDGRMPLRAYEARRYGLYASKATPEEREESQSYRTEYEALMKAWRKANPDWDYRLTRGKELYQLHCAGCHGDEGRGNGPASAWLMIRPRDFTRGLYRYRSTEVGKMPLDGDIYRSLHRGLPGSSMPSWAHLPDEHLWLLVDYVKHFQETQGGRAAPFNNDSLRIPVPPMPAMAPSKADEIYARGRAAYAALKCVNCHGSTGRGDGVGWDTTTKDNGALIRPRDFVPRDEKDRPELRMRGGARPQDLYRTVFTGLSGANMPAVWSEFERAWNTADKYEALKAAGAPQAEIDAAEKAARVWFFVSLDEGLPGVKTGTNPAGKELEYMILRRTKINDGRTIQFGDDWALMYYLRRAMQPDYVWPLLSEEDDE